MKSMKIAITGARGSVGREVVRACAEAGHSTVQVDGSHEDQDTETPRTEMRTADTANDYDALVAAIKDCDAFIHLAAVPDPVDKPDHFVHQTNVCSAFNGFRAAAEVGIKRICYASSVNTIGLVYSNQPLNFPYFPIDEEYTPLPTDAYALAKQEAEVAAESICRWFPGTKIACLRIQQIDAKKAVEEDYEGNHEKQVKQLWGWVSPAAVGRACLLAVENADRFEGMEVINIVAPGIVTAGGNRGKTSEELAGKYFPQAEQRGVEGDKGVLDGG
ncbi:hypothetical protein QBC35DRAFT_456716 [Podospora australis]|uniref:NAD-dependent epimerase/dehydratase domain-containing protein n=1 Tax=Podospora australis TaxID=1536484 RepID=A0AAN7AEL9_9PEZI|nr:hypothetical protein QBC35DRAFT_456716 [Podospora australis]